jgi:asparagine synthase (glutamine-hydrolysing)
MPDIAKDLLEAADPARASKRHDAFAYVPRRDMTESSSGLATGQPSFGDAELDHLARSAGALTAWQAAARRPGGLERALQRTSGRFAVALVTPGTTWLAVDRFATRPLCYRQIGDRLHFGARADELAALEPAAPIDPQALYDYLYHHVIPSPRTAFAGVYRLPAGHLATFAEGAVRVRPYWTPAFETPSQAPFETLAAEFRSLLELAVRDSLDGSKPACFLSGGTDSSTVAGMVARAAGRVATYSIGFDAQGYDEMQYARIAARHFGSEHHEYYVTPQDVHDLLPAVAAHHDQPFGNSSALPAYCCARMARDDGVARLLAGDGGDELFGGNARYAKQRIFDAYGHVPAALRRGVLEPLLAGRGASHIAPLRKAASYVQQARAPMPDRLEMYNLLLRVGAEQILDPALLRAVDAAEPLKLQREVWRAADAHSTIDRTLAFDWRYTLAEADLPKVRGSVEMAGMQTAFPMLDDRLLAFSMRLPPHYKLRGLKLRWFFKEALRGFLPEEILRKRKQGFGLPFGVWAVGHEGLRALAADAMRSLAQRRVVRAEFVEQLLQRLLPSHPGYYGELVWILTSLELWLRQHRPGWKLEKA